MSADLCVCKLYIEREGAQFYLREGGRERGVGIRVPAAEFGAKLH